MAEIRHPELSLAPAAPEVSADFEVPADYDATTDEYILKVQELCNLACDYCYMYEHRDQSWAQQPRVMSDDVLIQTGIRIGEHLDAHEVDEAKIFFHGGEPLMNLRRDPGYFRRATGLLSAGIGAGRAEFFVQTNGTLLTEENIERLAQAGIHQIGISIDGDHATHDAHRKYANGRGSFEDVARGIRTLVEWNRRHDDVFKVGLLSVINPASDPLKVYNALKGLGVNDLDFLIPLAHHSALPPGYGPDYKLPNAPTPYADWLKPIYDAWSHETDQVFVRLFNTIQRLIKGQGSLREYLGSAFARSLVIESSGVVKITDSHRAVATDGSSLGGLNVFQNTIDEAVRHPKIVEQRLGAKALSAQCQRCDIKQTCGGGLQASRWQDDPSLERGGSFDHESVYCRDLSKIIGHIAASTRRRMQSAVIGHYLDTDLQNAELNVKNISFIAGPKAPPETAVQEYTVDDLQVVHLVRGKKELLLAGVPEHLQQLDGHQPWLQEVTEKWFQRLGRTAVAVLEGGLRPDIERQKLDLEAAVARHAEPGLLAALALKHHARPWDAEPPADGLWDLLAFKDQHPELGIKKDDIVAFFGLRGIPQWCRLRDQGIYIPLEKYLPTLIWERCGKHMTYKDLVAVGRKRLGDFGGDKFFSGDELVLDDDDAAKYFMAQTTGFNLPTKELRSVLQHIAAANEASRFQSFAGQLHTLWRQELSSLFVTHKVYSGLIAKAVKSFCRRRRSSAATLAARQFLIWQKQPP